MGKLLSCFILISTLGCQSQKTTYGVAHNLLPGLKAYCGGQQASHCMACALQGEAANQTPAGVYAVGVTIMTRAKGNLSKVCRVTKARYQFEGMKKTGYRKISNKIWRATQKIIKKKEKRWTHFWSPKEQGNLGRKKPFWAKTYEARRCDRKKIDGHIFYNANKCRVKRKYQRLPASQKKL